MVLSSKQRILEQEFARLTYFLKTQYYGQLQKQAEWAYRQA